MATAPAPRPIPMQTQAQKRRAVRDLPTTRIEVFGRNRFPRIDGIEVDLLITVEISEDKESQIFIDGSRVLYPTRIWSNGKIMISDKGRLAE